MTSPFDPGLQVERTSLSWMRTALALAVAGAVLMRITLVHIGLPAVSLGLAGIALALVAAGVASSRYRRAVSALHETGELSTDGRVLALSSASTVLIGLAAILFVVWELVSS